MSEQYVYFIQADEAGPIKIGFTSGHPNARLAQLQTGNSSTLKLLGAIKGTAAQEKQFHSVLSNWRMQGEWFEPHPTVLAAVQEALASASETATCTGELYCHECLRCSFCFRCKNEVEKLIRGAAANICNECADLCADIAAERAAKVQQ